MGVGADARNDASGANVVDWMMNMVVFDDVLWLLNRMYSVEELECVVNVEKVLLLDEDEDEGAKTKTRGEAKKWKMTKEEKKVVKKVVKRVKKNEIVVNWLVVSYVGRYYKWEL